MCIWRKQVFQGVCNIIWRVVNVHSTATADWLLVFFRYTTPATTPTKATAPTPTAIRESGDSASTLLFNLKKRTLHVVWLVLNHTYLTYIINSMLCVSSSLVYSLCILLWVYPWYTLYVSYYGFIPGIPSMYPTMGLSLVYSLCILLWVYPWYTLYVSYYGFIPGILWVLMSVEYTMFWLVLTTY